MYVGSLAQLPSGKADSDYHRFLHLKKLLSVQRFHSDREMQTAVTHWFRSQTTELLYGTGIQKWIPRYDKYINSVRIQVSQPYRTTEVSDHRINTGVICAHHDDNPSSFSWSSKPDFATQCSSPNPSRCCMGIDPIYWLKFLPESGLEPTLIPYRESRYDVRDHIDNCPESISQLINKFSIVRADALVLSHRSFVSLT
ncbi:hypothetical protein ANN_21596 [Periplaneta americana]|uniref:Uncharacterized protein n=1 Tax=Periplaneta americana TaxID=6978 RepID=A0ABQ8S6Z0_PERAM|nr:hypothetical protein ANN_21596 [Periplaneta americana]